MYDIYGAPGFLAAYNAGPGRLDDYLTRNRTLPAETRRYVASIGPRITGYEPQRPSPGAQYAMNALPLDIAAGPRYPQLATQFASAEPAAPIVLNPPRPITLNSPTEVAEAPGPFIKLNAPALDREPVIAEPVAPHPVAVAQAAPAQRYIQLSAPAAGPDSADRFAALEPARSLLGAARRGPHRGRARRRAAACRSRLPPSPTPRPAQFAHRSGFGPARPIEVAEFPEPPRPPSQRFAAAAELMPLGPHSHGFGFIPAANAAPVRPAPAITATNGAWAVQVGAFANHNMASAATEAAREHVRDVLGSARTVVAGVHGGGGTLYRARLGGLSREAAAHACERLSQARTSCMVVSPEAQR